jgi:hypothetical protein
MWQTIRELWNEASRPESFVGRAWETTENQWGHFWVGLSMAALVCVAWDSAFGEMPYRTIVFGWVVGAYFGLWEIARQGWQGSDTLDDTYFFGLGAAAVLVSLHEVETDLGPMLDLKNENALAAFAAFIICLFFNAWEKRTRT